MNSIRKLRSILAIGLACVAVAVAIPVASAQIPPDPQTGNVTPVPASPNLTRVTRLEAPGSTAGNAPVVVAPRAATGFDWTDTGIAAGSAGGVLLLAAGVLVTRRARRALPELAVTD